MQPHQPARPIRQNTGIEALPHHAAMKSRHQFAVELQALTQSTPDINFLEFLSEVGPEDWAAFRRLVGQAVGPNAGMPHVLALGTFVAGRFEKYNAQFVGGPR